MKFADFDLCAPRSNGRLKGKFYGSTRNKFSRCFRGNRTFWERFWGAKFFSFSMSDVALRGKVDLISPAQRRRSLGAYPARANLGRSPRVGDNQGFSENHI